jgi:hypothetical protein
MARTIQWNARGNTRLTAPQRATVEAVANLRRDRQIQLGDPAAISVEIVDGIVRAADGEVIGTMTGLPDIGAAAVAPESDS